MVPINNFTVSGYCGNNPLTGGQFYSTWYTISYNGFWVDLYVTPASVPTWYEVSSPMLSHPVPFQVHVAE